MLRYMQSAELRTIVRAPSRNSHHILPALDMGAEGLMLSMVSSGDEAVQIVAHAKYPSQEHHGVALQVAHDRYQPGPVLKKLRDANKGSTIFAQIETPDGVTNADDIATVKGIDCLWVGHFDLSASMGIPGQFDHPDFKAAVKKVGHACKMHKESFSRLVPNVATSAALFRQGFNFICYSGDVWIFQVALKDGIDQLRAKSKGERPKGR